MKHKSRNYTEDQRKNAISRLRGGETIAQVSKDLNLDQKHIKNIIMVERRRERIMAAKDAAEKAAIMKAEGASPVKGARKAAHQRLLEAAAAVEKGMSIKEATAKYRVGSSSIYTYRYRQKQKQNQQLRPPVKAERKSSKKDAQDPLPFAGTIIEKLPPRRPVSVNQYETLIRQLSTENMNLRLELLKM